jgi:translation initiation factor IF-3
MKNQRARILANRDIRHKSVRIVTDGGSEVLPTVKALEQAELAGLDLILINENAEPPVCKILDLNKYHYDLQRKEKEAAKAQRESRVTVKEVQFKPNIDDHDFDTKCRNIERFIKKGNKVKLLVQFRGRERQYTEIGYDIVNRVVETLAGVELDGPPQLAGNRITAMLKGEKDGS